MPRRGGPVRCEQEELSVRCRVPGCKYVAQRKGMCKTCFNKENGFHHRPENRTQAQHAAAYQRALANQDQRRDEADGADAETSAANETAKEKAIKVAKNAAMSTVQSFWNRKGRINWEKNMRPDFISLCTNLLRNVTKDPREIKQFAAEVKSCLQLPPSKRR